ncbi:hypothetical protein [Sediminicurvatus halobius]|uniref:Uncharacterized protein n=1 Tax=Sediminicurvatus halobius TaxID=2182432 RepID=A0A2U2NA07_9GAMM|nr:hypothetical protein [Spiribacter halobius]PWG65809.1 hypothetical protein DEM34_00660 [Spiribacter halobius]UEX77851.1 hypothetical protein LMH63_18295 [Spiribacter halobius]
MADQAGLDRLLARAERDGLLRPRHRWPRWSLPGAIAAGLAAAVIVIGPWGEQPAPTDPIRYRGLGTPIEVAATDPERWIEDTMADLRSAGCAADRDRPAADGSRTLVADVAPGCLEAFQRRLGDEASEVEAPGRYRIRVSRP